MISLSHSSNPLTIPDFRLSARKTGVIYALHLVPIFPVFDLPGTALPLKMPIFLIDFRAPQ